MGAKHSKSVDGAINEGGAGSPPDVNFDDFEVLRAIGRGAFGKVHMIDQLFFLMTVVLQITKLHHNSYVANLLFIGLFD